MMQTSTKGAISGAIVKIALLAIAVGGTSLTGQTGGEALPPRVLSGNSSWPEVSLNVVVLDKQGRPEKLVSSELRLFEDGAERPILSITAPDAPVSLALIIDTSGSTYKRGQAITSAVTTIIKALPADSEVMAVLFADQAYLDLPFTPVSKVDLSFLNRQDARGGTALFDTVVVAERYFAEHAHYARRALILFSDGGDNESHSQKIDAIHSLQLPSTPTFYSLFLCDLRSTPFEVQHPRKTMEDLARAGGGIALMPTGEKDFELVASRLADMIRSQYALRFTAADPALDGKAHKLEVRFSIQDLRILAPPIYYAPTR